MTGIINKYAERNLKWKKEEYELEFLRRRNKDIFVFFLLYKEDLQGLKLGGESVELHIDVNSYNIVNVLGSQ